MKILINLWFRSKQVNTLGDDVKERILAGYKVVHLSVKVSSAVLKVIIRDMAKRRVTKQTKWFPVVGQAVSASISYYFMNKLGREHIEKCEKVLHDII